MVIRDIFASYDALYDVSDRVVKDPEENEDFSAAKNTSESSDGKTGDHNRENNDSPAVELILSNGMMREIRFLSQKTLDFQSNHNEDSKEGFETRVSKMIDRCATLKIKASDRMITSGEKTYIQSEIDRIKREVCSLNIAL